MMDRSRQNHLTNKSYDRFFKFEIMPKTTLQNRIVWWRLT